MLVTGANGFVGGALARGLRDHGWRVRALVRNTLDLPAGVDVVPVTDLLDRAALASAVGGADAVVHLAARVHVMRETDDDPLAAYRRTNVEGTRALLAATREAGVRCFVFTSSVKAVGEATTVRWTAATPAAPSDPYGISKLEAEELVRHEAAGSGLRAAILRLPVVYGPGMRANMLRLFRLVDRGLPLPVGGIDNLRSFVFVGNVVAAIEAVLVAPGASGTYFVSDGEDLTTAELARRIGRALGRPVRLLRIPTAALQMVGRAGDLIARVLPFPITSGAVRRLTNSLVVDPTELTAATGFVPPYTVDQGLALTARWYRERGSVL